MRTCNPYPDTYGGLSSFDDAGAWGPYNVHDPAMLSDGEYVYAYSTDVAFGRAMERAGIQVRRSRDLVDWEFCGWAVDGRPSQALAWIDAHGGGAFENVWAPFALRHEGQYRLYYSLSSRVAKNSVIGLLTGPSPLGPWKEAGLVVTSQETEPGTNAIDPSVVITPEGEHWLLYGSAWDGIYALQLEAETGLAMHESDRGIRVVQRGSTNGHVNGNLEGPEIFYHPGFDKYYLFYAYDWLFTKYNVRVARADRPEGPYADAAGRPVNDGHDRGAMILAPYRFDGHEGWQGVAHCGVVEHAGRYFLASQGRPVERPHFMVMHCRQLYWTDDGWPVVSPQRYAGMSGGTIAHDELPGNWELIEFDYRVVPGFAREQVDPDLNESQPIRLHRAGSVDAEAWRSWRVEGRSLVLRRSADAGEVRLLLDTGWDWERQRPTLVATGLNELGYAVWLKRVDPVGRGSGGSDH